MLEQLGFIFIQWSSLGVDVDQSDMEFILDTVTGSIDYYYGHIPDASVGSLEKSDEESVRRTNTLQWNTIQNKNKHFLLYVAYNITLRKEKDRKTDRDDLRVKYGDDAQSSRNSEVKSSEETVLGETQRIYRASNLLDVAHQYLAEYCNYRSNQDSNEFISSSKNSFKCIYSIACLFRKWLQHSIVQIKLYGTSAFNNLGEDRCVTDKEQSKFNGLQLQHLFPCSSRMKSMLGNTCLSLTPEEFHDDSLDECLKRRLKRFNASSRKCSVESEINSTGEDREDDRESDDSGDQEENNREEKSFYADNDVDDFTN